MTGMIKNSAVILFYVEIFERGFCKVKMEYKRKCLKVELKLICIFDT